ncbi:type IV pilin protein [Haliea sp. E1-2-M8]|uniref:type IV pilin protein n=1 Tax=Haliea sp. E1-2-M8 TaxID=3064706 RepID=UPI002718D67D|nr:type IV pilin protein [Haliea sp. E1-2-M8]MDO8862479.1 type IV pilin protein [Haliea sp. E1-2-M8]
MNAASAGSHGKFSHGITLLELLVVMLLLGLLLLLVMPAYSEQARKARRVVATAELLQLAARQEHFFVNHRQYADDLTALGYSLPAAVGIGAQGQEVTAGALYEISLRDEGDYRFRALARPVGQQARDERCGTLGIDSDGVRTASGPGGLRECW